MTATRDGASDAGVRHRRPAWLPTFAAFVAIALCVLAGNWQHRRMLEKETQQARIDRAAALPAVALPTSVGDWRDWRYREVRVSGVYDAKRQILIDNRVHEGRVGFGVVTPLALADGRVVLVDRGFVPAGSSRRELPSPSPPPGDVTIEGRIDLPPTDYFELGDRSKAPGVLWQHVDPARFAAATGVAVLPIVIDATAPGDDGLLRIQNLPHLDSERNQSYMLQWYAFAALAAGLWAWFTVLRRFVQRRPRERV
jgi:surfeit locus 1 family protein